MHQALTVIARIKPERAEELESLLDTIGSDIRGAHENNIIKLDTIDSLQFGRWVMIPGKKSGRKEYLLFTSNIDGTIKDHISDFALNHREAMDRIWGCCEGYPTTTTPGQFQKEFYRFIRKHSWDSNAFYIGYHNEDIASKRAYVRFHDALDAFFNLPPVRAEAEERLRPLKYAEPADVLAAFDDVPEAKKYIDEHIMPAMQKLPPVHNMPPKPSLFTAFRFAFDFAWMFLWVFVGRPLRNLILRREPRLDLDLDDMAIQEGVAAIEDVVTQNQLTVISRVKPGLFVLPWLKMVLIIIHLVGKYYQNQGTLGGITTIHFARWTIIDKGRWLLFTSNYDGSWDSYIGEFSDKAAFGLDLVWRSAPRYPKKGARDLEPFKAIIRRNQVRTQVFYSSFPDRTIINLLNDGQIANLRDRYRAGEWLRRI